MKKTVVSIIALITLLCCTNTSPIEQDKAIVKTFLDTVLFKDHDSKKLETYYKMLSNSMDADNEHNLQRKKMDSLIKAAMVNGDSESVIKDYMEACRKMVFNSESKKIQDSINAFLINVYQKDSVKQFFKESVNDSIKTSIGFWITAQQEQIKNEHWGDYKITHDSEAEDNPELKKSYLYQALNYDKREQLFFVMFDNNPEKVIFFIIENHKIISFFTGLVKHSDTIKPLMLN